MKFKLDENLGKRMQDLFRAAGHEVHTVREEGLQGCSDARLYEACRSQEYRLVTLDLDFADVRRFPAAEAAGIVVIRTPGNPSLQLLQELAKQFLEAERQTPFPKNLVIVEVGRIRVHESESGT
jgi:predicted nuclease of predicted toxin-antitoxin system